MHRKCPETDVFVIVGGDDDEFADLVVEEDEGEQSDRNSEQTLEISPSATGLQMNQPAKKPRKKVRA